MDLLRLDTLRGTCTKTPVFTLKKYDQYFCPFDMGVPAPAYRAFLNALAIFAHNQYLFCDTIFQPNIYEI